MESANTGQGVSLGAPRTGHQARPRGSSPLPIRNANQGASDALGHRGTGSYLLPSRSQSLPSPSPRPKPYRTTSMGSFPGAAPLAHFQYQRTARLAATAGQALASHLEKKLKDRDHPLYQSIWSFCRGRPDDVRYEIDHVLDGLRTISKIAPYFGPREELSLAIMPRNWPLYSFLLFCLTPAAHADQVIVHYPDSIKDRVLPMIEALQGCVREIMGTRMDGVHLRRPQDSRGTAQECYFPAVTSTTVWWKQIRLWLRDLSALTGPANPSSAVGSPPAIRLPGFGDIVCDMQRTSEEFIKEHGKRAKVVVFTGSYNNYSNCVAMFRANSYPLPHFLFNGSGHNPVVVGPMPLGALPNRVERIVKARTTNGGQDCGAPDAILVHESVLAPFLRELHICLDRRPEFEYLETDDQFVKVARFIRTGRHAGRIHRGRCGNPLAREVTAVVSVQPLIAFRGGNFSRASNSSLFSELYAPIFNIIAYEHDGQLGQYFQQKQYQQRAQFTSLMSESIYVTTHTPKKSLLLDETVPEFDQAFEYYGGYGVRSSNIALRGRVRPQPINVGIDFRLILLRDTAERERSHLSNKRNEDINGAFQSLLDRVNDSIPGAVAKAFYYGQIGQQEQWEHSNGDHPKNRTIPREPIDPFAQIRCLVVAPDHLVPAVTQRLQACTARYLRDQAPDQILAPAPPTMPPAPNTLSSHALQDLVEAAPLTWHRAGSHSFPTEPSDGLAAALTRAGQLQNRYTAASTEVVRLSRYNGFLGGSPQGLDYRSSGEDRAIAAALLDPRKVAYTKSPGR